MSFDIKNLMEDAVFDVYDEVKDSLAGCKCEKCKYDIIAYTLNTLHTKYIASERGALYGKLNFSDVQFRINITTALMKSSEIISKNPRH